MRVLQSSQQVSKHLATNWADPREQVPIMSFRDAVRLHKENGEEVKYLPLLEEVKRCSVEDDFLFLPVWGKQRRGKSSLSLWQLYYIYGSWEEALKHLVYTMPDILDRIYMARLEKREIPLLVWDDVAVHGGKRTKSREPAFQSFSELFDAVGTVLHTLLTTCVRPDATVPALRERYLGEVVVEPRGHFNYVSYDWRLAYYLPAQPWFVKIWIEEGSFTAVPPDVYKVYKEDRQRLLDVKMAEVLGRVYPTSLPVPQLNELEKDILKRIDMKSTPVRSDNLHNTMTGQGYERVSVDLMLAKLESLNLVGKRGVHWVITPRGKQALHEPPAQT